jgi:hypothetical protein
MYLLAAVGLWGLWRRGTPPGRRLLGGLLAGFGLWHVVDSVLSHWLLGIHRIRVEAENPLAWDLLWLGAFGIVPLLAAWRLGRTGGGSLAPRGTLTVLALVALGAGGWALRPAPDQPLALAVFRPGLEPGMIEEGIEALGGRIVWAGPALDVALVDLAPERRWGLYGAGALLVAGAGLPAGCLGWSQPEAPMAGAVAQVPSGSA